jgi:hypothetical protein
MKDNTDESEDIDQERTSSDTISDTEHTNYINECVSQFNDHILNKSITRDYIRGKSPINQKIITDKVNPWNI